MNIRREAVKVTYVIEWNDGVTDTVTIEPYANKLPVSVEFNREPELDQEEMARQGSAWKIYKPGPITDFKVLASGAMTHDRTPPSAPEGGQ